MAKRTPFKGEGFEVVCPQCRGRFHQTTDKFDNTVAVTGDMLTLKDKYGAKGFNWGTFPESSGMRAGDLECPQCGALYCQGGHYLKSVDPIAGYVKKPKQIPPAGPSKNEPDTVEETVADKKDFTCNYCGKVCKSAAGLKNHQVSCSETAKQEDQKEQPECD